MAQTHTKIAVVGPASSGKTALLQTVRSALFAQCHGFSQSLFIQVDDNLSPFPSLPKVQPLTPFPIGFTLSTHNRSAKMLSRQTSQEPTNRAAVDTHSLALIEVGLDQASTQEELRHTLTPCEQLVLTLPVTTNLTPQDFDKLLHFTNRISAGHFGSFERCVIALTKSERYFAPFGSQALKHALCQGELAKLFQTELVIDRDLLYVLGQIAIAIPQTYLVPVSSFGYLKSTGQANVDPFIDRPLISPFEHERDNFQPHSASLHDQTKCSYQAGYYLNSSITSDTKNEAEILKQLWLPFLTADPFVIAATGLINPFTLPIDALIQNGQHAKPQPNTQTYA